ncbi:predicted protein [Chaetomium globosum CBS 148.51]|uniref:Uncharacterized protein n=1 Tax=Chaetomium globosum (strain ATCC 6205 / CBS 148.51 / DSM 1962 / NBRC 6347 / NRRL 1970) TaxID=306901 RepID=Q2HBJ8_CHAGB|nr:uncharacterized protein CHGG_02406 [Chaetomium globosum CBS 148.51]EAQ90471.1 predicted protein [Chaetomium globosum CBS 148.51]
MCEMCGSRDPTSLWGYPPTSPRSASFPPASLALAIASECGLRLPASSPVACSNTMPLSQPVFARIGGVGENVGCGSDPNHTSYLRLALLSRIFTSPRSPPTLLRNPNRHPVVVVGSDDGDRHRNSPIAAGAARAGETPFPRRCRLQRNAVGLAKPERDEPILAARANRPMMLRLEK